jgi:hypothetical protein
LNGLYERARVRVPKLDSLIPGSSPRRQQVPLPGAPCDRLDRGLVLAETVLGRADYAVMKLRLNPASHPRVDVPDAQKVVVAATGELLAVGTPFQATDFLTVALEGRHDARGRGRSDVVIMDQRIDRA